MIDGFEDRFTSGCDVDAELLESVEELRGRVEIDDIVFAAEEVDLDMAAEGFEVSLDFLIDAITLQLHVGDVFAPLFGIDQDAVQLHVGDNGCELKLKLGDFHEVVLLKFA